MDDWWFLGLDEPEFVTDTGHEVWGGMPIELEAAMLLYGLVRYAKPRLIVESGTGSGRSTKAIRKALAANGHGRLVTFEPDPRFRETVTAMFDGDERVEVRAGTSREAGLAPDFVFVDTGGGGEYRQPEINHWLNHPARPVVVVHDGNRDYGLHVYPGVNITGHDGLWIGQNHPH